MKRFDVLEAIEWAEDEFGSLVTGGAISRREVMRAVGAGLVVSVGTVRVVDGDMHAVEPERHREGFVLTEEGHAFIRCSRRAQGTP